MVRLFPAVIVVKSMAWAPGIDRTPAELTWIVEELKVRALPEPRVQVEAAAPVKLKAPVAPALKDKAPVPLAVTLMALLASVEVMSVPIVPLKTRPLVKVPLVLVMFMPLVVVPAEFWLNRMPLLAVPEGTPETTSSTSAAVALVVPLIVRPMMEAAVGEMTLLLGVLATLPVGTWTIQVLQVPAATQDRTAVEAPPSVCKTWPDEPSEVGKM